MYFSDIINVHRHGVMRMMPVDKHGNPLNTDNESREDGSDDSDN